jgi:NAD(P)-dependent dehydrogenase (short-subunit alcohol dehydrogenase family)
VALAGLHEESVRTAAENLVSEGHKALAIRCDVVDEAQVAAMVEQTVSALGRLDVAFNNAGVQSPIAETADASGEEFDRVLSINLRGIWSCMKYELLQMRKQGSGAIGTHLRSAASWVLPVEEPITLPSTAYSG